MISVPRRLLTDITSLVRFRIASTPHLLCCWRNYCDWLGVSLPPVMTGSWPTCPGECTRFPDIPRTKLPAVSDSRLKSWSSTCNIGLWKVASRFLFLRWVFSWLSSSDSESHVITQNVKIPGSIFNKLGFTNKSPRWFSRGKFGQQWFTELHRA